MASDYGWGLAWAWWPACLLLALAIDMRWGEPAARWHPVVAMGGLLAWAGRHLGASHVQERDWLRGLCGALAWCALATVVTALAWLLQQAALRLPWWLAWPLLACALKPLLAWRMLRDEVGAVETALAQSLPAGRERLSWLVSRDVSELSAGQVRESAIETLAENLNDSVVAPLFWFVLLGLPGAALYRFANTADAMWGYPGWRGDRHWQWAGKWAARADDVLSWLPARLTALLLVAVHALRAGQGTRIAWAALWRDAAITPSPNGGWPMGAMAQALGVRLGKPGVYVLNDGAPEPGASAMAQALGLAQAAIYALAAGAVLTGAASLLSVWWVGA